MTNQETALCIGLINSLWQHQRKLEGLADATVGGLISGYEFAHVQAAIGSLASREEWFHISKLIKLLEASGAKGKETALAGLQRALRALRMHSPPERGAAVSQRTLATVQRLGGWGVLGRFSSPLTDWNKKEWSAAWDEVQQDLDAGKDLAALAAPGRISHILSGAPGAPTNEREAMKKPTSEILTGAVRRIAKGGRQ